MPYLCHTPSSCLMFPYIYFHTTLYVSVYHACLGLKSTFRSARGTSPPNEGQESQADKCQVEERPSDVVFKIPLIWTSEEGLPLPNRGDHLGRVRQQSIRLRHTHGDDWTVMIQL
ncbi:hypothetical protein NPIL_373261 [Nephila pilipes]|uniref:Uncharacterized protein n=1 Tax=Nephila pilipes TaxID=299642 RepID=A0A8X6QUG3_NEPPI|nr:hypothetical protein NPIL_373261 [Nephila pilipes]